MIDIVFLIMQPSTILVMGTARCIAAAALVRLKDSKLLYRLINGTSQIRRVSGYIKVSEVRSKDSCLYY